MYYRQTYLKIHLDAIRHNIKAAKYRSGKELIGVIKANGYGAGDLELARLLISEGAVMLAVSSLDEALFLRRNNIRHEIIVLGYADPRDVEMAIKNNIILTVTSLDWVKQISSINPINLKVHIKIDTKMNRLGITTIEDFQTVIVLLQKLGVKIEGAYTHYAFSEEKDNATTKEQYQKFVSFISQTNCKFKWLHAANSDACFHFKDDNVTNAVRVGIALLGYASYADDLRPALELFTRISLVRHVPAGETISYGCTYTTSTDEIIATLPIGYADGLIRRNQGRLVFVNNEKVPIVGRICMDQCMIRLSQEAQINDQVEIFGQNIKLMDMAKELETIPYEIITLITNRVTRIYYDKNRIVKTLDPRSP